MSTGDWRFIGMVPNRGHLRKMKDKVTWLSAERQTDRQTEMLLYGTQINSPSPAVVKGARASET